jgi:hypothetical protein
VSSAFCPLALCPLALCPLALCPLALCPLALCPLALCPLALSILPGLTKLTGNQELWWAKTDILLAATRTWCATYSR